MSFQSWCVYQSDRITVDTRRLYQAILRRRFQRDAEMARAQAVSQLEFKYGLRKFSRQGGLQ